MSAENLTDEQDAPTPSLAEALKRSLAATLDPAPSPVAAEIAKIKERAEAATRGPWEAEDDEDCWRLFGAITPGLHPLQLIKAPKRDTPFAEYWPTPADAEFIEHARTDIPLLVAAIEALLAAHRPGGNGLLCADCADIWPCVDYRRIESALRGTQEEPGG